MLYNSLLHSLCIASIEKWALATLKVCSHLPAIMLASSLGSTGNLEISSKQAFACWIPSKESVFRRLLRRTSNSVHGSYFYTSNLIWKCSPHPKSLFNNLPSREREGGLIESKVKIFPAPMAQRAALISVSVALGHTSANAVNATEGGWSTGSSACLTFPLHSLMSRARREGSEYHF